MSEVPDFPVFRKTVDRIRNRRDSLLIKMLYLAAARVSEVLTKTSPYDLKHKQTKPYGAALRWRLSDYLDQKTLILKMAVAKRGKKETVFKLIALPCAPAFEPWTLDLLKRIEKKGNLNFPIVRSTAWRIVKKRLRALDSDVHTHSLRHYRLTHLVEIYGFDAYDLTIYSGWTFRTTMQASGQLDTYLHLDWRKYFPKLLKPIQI